MSDIPYVFPRLVGVLCVAVSVWILRLTVPVTLDNVAPARAFWASGSCRPEALVDGRAVGDGICVIESARLMEKYDVRGGRSGNYYVLLVQQPSRHPERLWLEATSNGWRLGERQTPGATLRLQRFRGGGSAMDRVIAVADDRDRAKVGDSPSVDLWFDLSCTLAGLLVGLIGSYWMRTGSWHPKIMSPAATSERARV